MGRIKRPNVLQMLQIWTQQTEPLFPYDPSRWAAGQRTSWQRAGARVYTCGEGPFSVNQKRDRECTTRPPTSRHVSYSSHMSAPIHWLFFITSVPEQTQWCVSTTAFLIPSCMFVLKKYQLFISTCLYFMDSTMEFMGGELYKPVREIPWWLQILHFFCTQEFVLIYA